MICPRCRAEYVPGVRVCYDCGVDLVAELPPLDAKRAPSPAGAAPDGAPPASFTLVTVYVSSDPALMTIAETILESAGIPLVIEGGGLRGAGAMGPHGVYHSRGPAALRVAPQDAGDARELLADLIADGERREDPAD